MINKEEFERKKYTQMEGKTFDYWIKTWPWSLSTQSETVLPIPEVIEEWEVVLETSKLTHPIFRHKWDSNARKGWAKEAWLKKYKATEDENIKLEEYLYKNKIKDVDNNWAFIYDNEDTTTPGWTVLKQNLNTSNPEPKWKQKWEQKWEMTKENAELIKERILSLRSKMSDEEIIAKYWKWEYWSSISRILEDNK